MGSRRNGFLLEKDVLESRNNSLMTLKARGFAQLFVQTFKKTEQTQRGDPYLRRSAQVRRAADVRNDKAKAAK